MKKIILTILLSFIAVNTTFSQEWLTSFKFAKRLALNENKMMLAIWENAANYSYPVILEDKNGKHQVMQLFENDSIKELVWKHFVPVIINESNYNKLSEATLGKRSNRYVDRFNDDYLKVMDPNGNILNVTYHDDFATVNLSSIIKNYSLNTSFFKTELSNYFENKNFATSFRLARKYLDAALYSNNFLKEEMIKLSDIYMSEAESLLVSSDITFKEALKQKIELLEIKKTLILSKPKKAHRLLKKYSLEEIDKINLSLFSFLNFTTYRYLKKIDKAMVWQEKVLPIDLKKVKLIINE